MFKKVLVPLDGTELAEGILPYVSRLAKGLDIPMLLVSVIDPDAVEIPERMQRDQGAVRLEFVAGIGEAVVGTVPSVSESVPEPEGQVTTHPHESGKPVVTQYFDAIEKNASRALENVAKELREEGLTVETTVAFGNPAEEIAEVADKNGCDLIAMSTHGRNAIGRGILGSVTDKVIHSAHLPTMTITPEKAEGYSGKGLELSKILVPLDGSPLAESVIPFIEDMALKLNLRVILVRVIKLGGMYTAYADGYPYSGSANIEAEIEADAVEYLKTAAERLEGKGINTEWKILKGAPAVCIADLAKEMPQDIIALATHGRSGLTRWVIGSVAEALVRASGDPVLIIPPN